MFPVNIEELIQEQLIDCYSIEKIKIYIVSIYHTPTYTPTSGQRLKEQWVKYAKYVLLSNTIKSIKSLF